MQVQVLFPAPLLDTSFDTMSIEAGVQFLFAKPVFAMVFIYLLTKVGSTVTEE